MRTKESVWPVIIKRVIWAAFLLLAFTLQSAVFGSLPVAVTLLAPMTAAVCAFETELGGLFFGLLGGALYDLASPVSDGVYALLFAVLGCAAALMMRYVLRSTLFSVWLIALVFAFCTAVTGFIFTVLAKDFSGALTVFRQRVLPGALLTALILPLFYYPVRAVDAKLR